MLDDFVKPHIREFCDRFADETIENYYKNFTSQGTIPSQRFIEEFVNNILNHYPDADPEDLKEAFKTPRMLFCANHGGFENHPELIAATILSSMTGAIAGHKANPILSCTSINPNNATVPSGFLLAARNPAATYQRGRIIFSPRKYAMHYLDTLRPLDRTDVEQSLTRFQGILYDSEKKALSAFYPEKFGTSSFLSQTFNANTWYYQRFLSDIAHATPYFADDETISSRLLQEDLLDQKSFAARLFTDHDALFELCKRLSDKSNLWEHKRVCDESSPCFEGRGSVLFYHRRASGSIEQLSLVRSSNGKCFLKSPAFSIRLHPDDIAAALATKELVPTIYLCYCHLTFDHNVTLTGGIFFNFYIRNMLQITGEVFNLELNNDLPFRFMQSFLLPFKITSQDLDPLNQHRPLLNLDLKVISPMTPQSANQVLQSTIKNSLPLSKADMLLDFELSQDDIRANYEELTASLQSPAPFEDCLS